MAKNKKKKMKIWQKALLFFAELVVLCVVVAVWYIVDKFGKLEVKEIDKFILPMYSNLVGILSFKCCTFF